MKFTYKELLLILLLLAIPVGGYFWVFKPAESGMKTTKKELEMKSQKLADLHKALDGIKDLGAEVDKLSQAVEFFESKLPARHEIHKVLEQVTMIADDHRLETRLFKTLKPQPFNKYSEQPIEMEVYGEFDSFYQFLLDVEKLPRLTKITKMSLEKDKDKEGVTNAKFTLSIFFDHKNSKNS
ncbi:MAG: type 4a pilus biogenesis protein PilO [Sedimentisphaerales bacterium]|nr:type 4a pilus biogenesis protein PilO [Sedimentisphaerales bacterium]